MNRPPINSFEFWVDGELEGLAELRDYIASRSTAPPIPLEQLLEPKAAITLDSLDDSDWPDDNAFTPAEGSFLGRIIDFCETNPDEAVGLIEIDVEEGETSVVFNFPPHLEPPAELRVLPPVKS